MATSVADAPSTGSESAVSSWLPLPSAEPLSTSTTSTSVVRVALRKQAPMSSVSPCFSTMPARRSRSAVQGLARVSALSRQMISPECMKFHACRRCRAPLENGGFITMAS